MDYTTSEMSRSVYLIPIYDIKAMNVVYFIYIYIIQCHFKIGRKCYLSLDDFHLLINANLLLFINRGLNKEFFFSILKDDGNNNN